MSGLIRLLGSGASLVATASQIAMVAATWPVSSECAQGLCGIIREPLFELFIGWEPFIDNVAVGAEESSERRCPGRQADGSQFRLDHSPLPPGFNAHAYPDTDILACVKLAADGSVEAVRIVAGTGRRRLDSRLLRTIHRQWRFRPVEGVEDGQPWQRVRLNSSYGSGPMMEIPPPPL